MNTRPPPVMQQAQRQSMPVTDLDAIDAAMLRDKLADGYGQRNQAQAMRLQMADQKRQDWSATV